MSRKRPAVTAVELLVVIAIIGILVALIMGGVAMVRNRDQQATTVIEIREMTVALENFKTKYGVYPPSQVTVAPSAAASDPILQQIWPNLDHATAFGPQGWGLSGPVTLKGDQCLVFFLGGRHDATGCYGFSTSKRNPFQMGGDREPPLFNFKQARLYPNASSPFFSYCDGYFKTIAGGAERFPRYAYFTPTKTGGYIDSHCSTATDSKGNYPKPYQDASGAYLNKQSFQIVSAGKDTYWGNARKWASGSGIVDSAGNGDSSDNITNFSGGILSGN